MTEVEIETYQETNSEILSKLFDDYQKELVAMDPDKRLSWELGFGKEYLTEHLERTKKYQGQFYLAIDNNKIVGFCISEVSESGTAGKITELYVEPLSRGKGLATTLIEKTEEYLKDKGCKDIWISVLSFNPTALELYKKLNYKQRDISLLKTL